MLIINENEKKLSTILPQNKLVCAKKAAGLYYVINNAGTGLNHIII
jgi:hypothetical protein